MFIRNPTSLALVSCTPHPPLPSARHLPLEKQTTTKTGFIVKRVYENFVEKAVDETLTRCRDDLTALTRFVTWDLHERSAGALRRSLPDSSMVHIYSMAVSNGLSF